MLALLFIGFVSLGINDIRNHKMKLEHKQIELHDKAIELNEIKIEKEKLDQEFEKATEEKTINEERVKELEREKLELEERYRQLEISKANERKTPKRQVAGATSTAPFGGNKQSWLEASGIPESEWWAVDSIVTRESGWRPDAVNPTSGACGLGQQLPCGKWAGAWNDPVAALKAQYKYVVDRYGGYPQAVAFWNINHWY